MKNCHRFGGRANEIIKEHKPPNVGRIALERQARRKTFDPAGIRTTDLPIHKHIY